MSILIKGEITLRERFEVEVDITEEEFKRLPHRRKEDLVSGEINWRDWLDSADVADLDIDEIDKGSD